MSSQKCSVFQVTVPSFLGEAGTVTMSLSYFLFLRKFTYSTYLVKYFYYIYDDFAECRRERVLLNNLPFAI